LARLGLSAPRSYSSDFNYRIMIQDTPCPDRYPRRDGVPEKRPLF
jgi:hypothetical protein